MGSRVKLYWSLAGLKKHPETIILIHNMFGSHRSVWRHQKWLNGLGYNTVSFDLPLGTTDISATNTLLALPNILNFFVVWKNHIAKVCDQVTGPKIIYSFSGPSLSAILAASEQKDIEKLICDGGPFANIYANTRNLFKNKLHIKREWLIKPIAVGFARICEKEGESLLRQALLKWPQDRTILSIRGAKDQIVPPESTAKAFSGFKGHLQVLNIKEGAHLDGLKGFPDIYKPVVEKFLEE